MTGTLAFVAVLGLASYRVTRVVTKDTILDRARTWLARWAYDENNEKWRSTRRRAVVQFSTCPFCVGVWVTAALYLLWDHAPDARFLVIVAAAAGVQALISSRPAA